MMRTLTRREAEQLTEESKSEPLEMRRDIDPSERQFFASLVRRGYLREVEHPSPYDPDWVFVTWEITPYGMLALNCYRAALVLA